MSRQQLLLRQDLTISQVLRTYGKQFRQIQSQYSDGNDGRCALGVIMSYFGLLIDLNDFGMSFDEIANYLDRTSELT